MGGHIRGFALFLRTQGSRSAFRSAANITSNKSVRYTAGNPGPLRNVAAWRDGRYTICHPAAVEPWLSAGCHQRETKLLRGHAYIDRPPGSQARGKLRCQLTKVLSAQSA